MSHQTLLRSKAGADGIVSIRERLTDDMKSAMRARETLRLETIRMIRAEILVKDKETGEKATEADIVRILQSMVKKRHDAAAQYREGKREELAEKEITESRIVEGYLPAQLSEEELSQAVRSVISEMGATSMKDMGRVMSRLNKELEGQAAPARVSQKVKEMLQD